MCRSPTPWLVPLALAEFPEDLIRGPGITGVESLRTTKQGKGSGNSRPRNDHHLEFRFRNPLRSDSHIPDSA